MAIDFGGKKNPPSTTVKVTSYNQSGGITAHTVNISPPARHLDPASEAHLLSLLPHGKPVDVKVIAGDGEAFAFAAEIVEALKRAGYPITPGGITQAWYAQPFMGQVLNVEGPVATIQIGSQPR